MSKSTCSASSRPTHSPLGRWIIERPVQAALVAMAGALMLGQPPRQAGVAEAFDPSMYVVGAAAMSVAAGPSAPLVAGVGRTPDSAATIEAAMAQAKHNAAGDGTSGTAGSSVGDPDAQVPIRSIVLYRSGVGAFERRGSVEGDAEIQLRFRTEQINDMLKSMVLLDLDGGSVRSVRYGSRDPLDRRLASFGVNIADEPSLPKLLSRLRGSAVTITLQNKQSHAGTILGVESRKIVTGEGHTSDMPTVNLIAGTAVRSIDIGTIDEIRLSDAQLQRELEMALAAIAEQRTDNIKTVDVSFTGRGSRRVSVSYVHEMPVWKTSYRLVLPEKEGDEAILQGWAIVENTTDEDWKDVTLSLVSGRPVGFEMDLYEPLYLSRPRVPVPVLAGVMPRTYEGAEVERQASKLVARGEAPGSSAMRRGMNADRGGDVMAIMESEAGAPSPMMAPSIDIGQSMASVEPAALAGDVGEQFQFRLTSPVTIERQRSAMIPIVSSGVEARRVSIYSAGEPNAMRGVELTNADTQIIPGPVAVYDAGSYAGDAQVGHVPAGDRRLIAHAVDMDLDARSQSTYDQRVAKLRVVNGLVEQTIVAQQGWTYRFDNKDTKRSRTIIVEVPKQPGWELRGAKPTQETAGSYRFEVELASRKAGELAMSLEQTQSQTLALLGLDLATLRVHVSQGKASAKIVEAFQEASRLQAEANTAQQKVGELEQRRAEIDRDQARIRENLRAIDRNSELHTRYMARLTEQETAIERLGTETAQARQRVLEAQSRLAQFIAGLNIE